MLWIQAAAIALIALILTPGWLFYFDVTPKLLVLLAATALLLPAVSRVARPRPFVTGFVLLFTLSLTLSTALSPHPALAIFGATWRRYGALSQFALMLFAWTVIALGARRTILRAIALSTALAAVYGIAQYAGFDPLLPASAYHVGEGVWSIVRPPGTLGYVSYFATWLVVAAFLGLALAQLETSRAWRYAAWGSSALAILAMLLTGTRAAILGLLAGALLWLFRRGFRIRARTLGLAATLAVVAAGFFFSPAGWQLRSRARWFSEDPWGGARLTLWRDSLVMGLSHPLFGFGPEQFTARFPAYESVQLARAYPDFAHESPHNIFLDALISQGLPGVLLLAALLAAGFRTRDPALAAALAAAVVSQQFTVFTLPTALLTFTTVALALPSGDPVPAASRSNRMAFAWAPAALLLLYCAIRFTAADAFLARARNHLRQGNAPAAELAYSRYSGWKLPGASADLWYSRSLLELATRTADPAARIQLQVRSTTAGMQATESAEDPFNAWYSLAQLAAARNDAPATERALRQAIEARPNWFKPHWTLALLLDLQGRRTEASSEAALAIGLDGGKHPEVATSLKAFLGRAPLQE